MKPNPNSAEFLALVIFKARALLEFSFFQNPTSINSPFRIRLSTNAAPPWHIVEEDLHSSGDSSGRMRVCRFILSRADIASELSTRILVARYHHS